MGTDLRVAVPGGRLHARLDGSDDPDAPLVVLANGLGTDMRLWDAQLAALGGRLRLLRYDTRGHGGSPVVAGPCSVADLGADVLALLDHIGAAAVGFAGVSLGAMTGLWLAAHAPDRIERLAVLCGSAHLPPADGWRDRAVTVRRDGIAAIADAVMARWFTAPTLHTDGDDVRRCRSMLLETDPDGYASCCDAIAAMDLRPDLRSIRAPTLVVAGRDDPVTPPSHAAELHEAITASELHVVAGASHLANVERPDRVNELLLAHFTMTRRSR